jgi:hypothetical protein
MDNLAEALVNNDYDVKALIRLIASSDAYQRSTTPNSTNERDEQNYSRAMFRRMDAEVLMDAVCQVTGLPEKFPGNPPGIRAIELWDSGSKHYFLNLFGRPLRKSVCQCERNVEPNISQVLHVLNSAEIQSKLQHQHGQIARTIREYVNNESAVEEMYLMFYSRRPTTDETKLAVDYFQHSNSRREASEDLAWSLLNSYEFLFNH